jgi:hypothetical protein
MAWNPLTDINDDADAKEKHCINRIFFVTMGDLKRYFLKWHQIA